MTLYLVLHLDVIGPQRPRGSRDALDCKVFVFSLQEVVKLPLEFVRQLSIKIQHQRPGTMFSVNFMGGNMWFEICWGCLVSLFQAVRWGLNVCVCVCVCVSAWRCDKVMDIYSGCALCLPNLTSPILHQPTHTPPLCIEIKVHTHTHAQKYII